MASRYPAVTARQSSGAVRPNFRPGSPKPNRPFKPHGPNRPRYNKGAFEEYVFPIARQFNPFDKPVSFAIWIGETFLKENEVTPIGVTARVPFPSTYWAYTYCANPCWGLGSTINSWTGTVTTLCTCGQDLANKPTNRGVGLSELPATTADSSWMGYEVGWRPDGGPLPQQWYYAGKAWITRKASAPVPTPTTAPGIVVNPIPAPIVLPDYLPIAMPIANTSAMPLVVPSFPGEQPSKPENKPEPNKRPRPRPERPLQLPVMPFPIFRPSPRTITFQPPGTIVTPAPNGPRVTPAPPVNTSAPPKATGGPGKGKPPRTEKKAKMSVGLGVVWAGIGTVTEAMDFVNAMHASIPRSSGFGLSEKASKWQKVRYMLTTPEAWEHIDLAEALQNYVNMQVGDFFSAIGSDASKKVMQDLGIRTGLDRALRQMGAGVPQEFVPELDIDRERGVIRVTFGDPAEDD